MIADKIVGIDLVLAKLERNAEGFQKARAVGLHSVGLPWLKRCNAAGVQRQHPVGDRRGQFALVSRHHNGAVALAEAGQQLDHLPRALHVHVGERLVEQQQFRHGKQHARQRRPLPHALRVLAEGAVQLGVEAHLHAGLRPA